MNETLRKMCSLKRSDLRTILNKFQGGIHHRNISGISRINSLNLCNFNDFVVENANNRVNCMLGYFRMISLNLLKSSPKKRIRYAEDEVGLINVSKSE